MLLKSPSVWVVAALAFSADVGAYTPVPTPDMDHTELHEAAERGDLAAVRSAWEALPAAERAVEVNRLDREGFTPLAYAAASGGMEVLTFLVEAGAETDKTDARGGWTPLLRAAQHRRPEAVRFLAEKGADVNVKTPYGSTPLTEAILGSVFREGTAEERDATVDALLKAGADVNLPGRNGWTPYAIARMRADEALMIRLKAAGANDSGG